jgi:hypothetical protein
MELTSRELWTLIHGMGVGSVFLIAFAGGLAGLYSLQPELVTPIGIKERIRRLDFGTVVMALAAWATVFTGTWIVYPWYRAKPPEGADLSDYPRYFLLDSPATAGWHTFGMEWKEHVAWIAPILATAVAFIVWRYGSQIAEDPKMRRALMIVFTLAFAAAGIAGLFGALITKAAPII